MIKKANKGSFLAACDRNNYLLQSEKQLSDTKVYKDVIDTKNALSKISEASNEMFSSLKRGDFFTERQMKYFTCELKKATFFGKLHLLLKIHKRLHNVPGRSVNSNCGSAIENYSEFLNHYLENIMHKGWPYVKDSGDFVSKTKILSSISKYSTLVTAALGKLYPSIPHEAG